MSAAAIAVQNVAKRLGSHPALAGVTLEVAAGESLAVLGPSGCGKTTLLRLIAGLEVPDSGEIWLGGAQVAGPGRSLVAPHQRGIGFVFQDLALWPHLSVQGNLLFVLASVGVPSAARPARVDEALTMVRADQLASRYPHELSGGEQQRVALARALVGQPRVLLLDEPLSSLDHEMRVALRGELLRIQSSFGATSVYVTHDRADAAVLADRVMDLRAGRVVSIADTPRTKRHA